MSFGKRARELAATPTLPVAAKEPLRIDLVGLPRGGRQQPPVVKPKVVSKTTAATVLPRRIWGCRRTRPQVAVLANDSHRVKLLHGHLLAARMREKKAMSISTFAFDDLHVRHRLSQCCCIGMSCFGADHSAVFSFSRWLHILLVLYWPLRKANERLQRFEADQHVAVTVMGDKVMAETDLSRGSQRCIQLALTQGRGGKRSMRQASSVQHSAANCMSTTTATSNSALRMGALFQQVLRSKPGWYSLEKARSHHIHILILRIVSEFRSRRQLRLDHVCPILSLFHSLSFFVSLYLSFAGVQGRLGSVCSSASILLPLSVIHLLLFSRSFYV